MFKSFIAVLALFGTTAYAVPKQLDVVSPRITAPEGGDVWTIGSVKTVTWDKSSIPPSQSSKQGMLLLGYNANDSENLNITDPLATDFLLTDGQVNVTVPDVKPMNNYIVILFGDSGNTSPEFSIVKGDDNEGDEEEDD